MERRKARESSVPRGRAAIVRWRRYLDARCEREVSLCEGASSAMMLV